MLSAKPNITLLRDDRKGADVAFLELSKAFNVTKYHLLLAKLETFSTTLPHKIVFAVLRRCSLRVRVGDVYSLQFQCTMDFPVDQFWGPYFSSYIKCQFHDKRIFGRLFEILT